MGVTQRVSTVQERLPSISLPRRALDLTGQDFGLLRALHPVSVSERGVLWLCRCDCGRLAIRSATTLRQPGEHQCSVCLRELRHGFYASSREIRIEKLTIMWVTTGRLYSDMTEKWLYAQIRSDCEEHDIPFGEPEPDLMDENGADRNEDEERYCRALYEATNTLEEVGKFLDVTRERVRQIALRAFIKLKANQMIRELWSGNPSLSGPEPVPQTTLVGVGAVVLGGCECRCWDSVVSNVIYCRWCGRTWALPDREIRKLITCSVLDRAVTFEDEK